MPNTFLHLTELTFALTACLGACASDSAPQPSATGVDHGSGTDLRPDAALPEAMLLEGILIDDFEDGDDQTLYPGGAWFLEDDKENGGGSAIAWSEAVDGGAAMNGPGQMSSRSLEVSFTFDQGSLTYPPYVNWGVTLARQSAPLDASQFLGIGYSYRGHAHRVCVQTFEVEDWDYFGMDMPASADWRTVVVPFRQVAQEGWGEAKFFNPENLGGILFTARGTTGEQGKVDIDNLLFLAHLPDQPPDMTVNPPKPPADQTIDSLTINNPNQVKARAYLDRGYNITNWLEEGPFTGFTYDGAFVLKLAAAGFKSLRLPIDIDRYVLSSTVTEDVADVVLSDDLFTVLDAFVTWTGNVGMALTIDYHQYDKSLNMAKPETIAVAVAVWGKIAARYADNPREDLFYELLNEPELSMDGTPPTQDEWTAIAERMIAAIRATDTTHTIVFGDVSWYGIVPLSHREPLSDDNVIYAFHFYEPMVFTGQGASWVGMSSTHDIPYPYSTERWSAYFGDLGLHIGMESWILAAARDYYQTGNRSYMRNLILKAKRWAVKNNVPVICNEFGVYDRTSRLEDRVNWLTDSVSIFDELEIPWQHWYMIMDAQGGVLPEYRVSLGLP